MYVNISLDYQEAVNEAQAATLPFWVQNFKVLIEINQYDSLISKTVLAIFIPYEQ